MEICIRPFFQVDPRQYFAFVYSPSAATVPGNAGKAGRDVVEQSRSALQSLGISSRTVDLLKDVVGTTTDKGSGKAIGYGVEKYTGSGDNKPD